MSPFHHYPGGAAHSKGILINPDTKSTLAIPHINNRKYRKEHKHANDQAALDRLLAPQFQSGAIAEERKSFDYQGGIGRGLGPSAGGDGIAGPSRGLDRLTSRSGSVKTHTSDGTGHGHGDANGGTKRRLLSGRHRSTRNDGRDGDGRSDGNDAEERLTSKTLGVYIDKQGRLHDKEYDPFETVRSLSQKKFERRSAFGASREDDSEAGSDISGSFVGREIGARNAGMLEAYERTTSDRQLASSNPAFVARDRQRVQDLQSRIRIEDEEEDGDIGAGYTLTRPSANGITGKSWNQDDDREYRLEGQEQEDSNEDATNRTVYSEYDSGVSATSPKGDDNGRHQSFARMGTTQKMPPSKIGRVQIDSQRTVPSSAASSSGSRSSPMPSNTSKQGPSTSMKTQASRLAQLEERPRSLLYPATPAQIAAQQAKAKGKRGLHGDPSADPDVFIPPVAPFNPAYHTSRPIGSQAPSLSSVERAISGRRGSYQHSHNRGNNAAASTVFASHEMSYLPTRWARGDHEIRVGEESIDKYRPLEWQGSQRAGVSGNGEPDWT
ncbi:hypothetical protein QFC19_002894 [Naganishia cerealis]|uniref:Uncharacterized protein n=1 Tax=Naganishia cerealis TaxID=610337 RepID=A0ACC2W7F2_9TREE|nr:hypothetical protein QFC19_002894 [Naganishia cerealis]